ncbi:hypothetical protein B0T24DRAFT_663087 [Lasiosphaeria ovina]|uniref:Ankyrin n=1 Tax=Lasiosphaeria ovina TaxID=92902 RepID=A0AAE0NCW3_9PEZI|nr:hypothetical protein B0T24DRAFT_663087 [Lasiosphaeria ovina]
MSSVWWFILQLPDSSASFNLHLLRIIACLKSLLSARKATAGPMDGLSAGAGAIAILQASGAIPSIIDTLRTLIHIGDEIKALNNELTTLLALQDHLKSQVDLLSGTDRRLRIPEPKMMQSARTTLSELVHELQELVARYKKKKRRRIRFVWDRNKIAQMGARARAARQELMMAITSDAGFRSQSRHKRGSRKTAPVAQCSEDPFFELLTVGRLLADLDNMEVDPSDPHPSTISMQASVYSSSSACPQSCSCRCHLSSALHTPSWFQPVLGSVLLSYSCIPLLGAWPCDQANCVRAASQVELTYYFPVRVLKRALCFSIEVGGSLGYGAGLHFGVPRVFSSHDEAWGTVNFGGPEDLKRLWAKRPGAYSPLDVTEADMSLLMVRLALARPKCFSSTHEAYVSQGGYVSQEDGAIAIQSGSSLSPLPSSSSPPLDLNQRDFLGRTPLIHASRIGNLPAVAQLLLRAGAKLIDARDSLGQTALLAALVGGHIRIALALLNAGCAVRVANDVGRTPLRAIFRTWDSRNPHPDAAEVLARLVQGGDVCARSSYGYTPLQYLHTLLGKRRERVRLRKLEDTTISIREETAAFESLANYESPAHTVEGGNRSKRSPWAEDQYHWRQLQHIIPNFHLEHARE